MASLPKTRLRVGVLGAAKVLRETWVAVCAAGHEIVAVGCRDVARGEKVVDELCSLMNIQKKPVVGNYEDVVASPCVDVVYIPIPVVLRHKWILDCAKHHKHVVCENPTATSCSQLEEWLRLFASKRLLFIDGTALSHGHRVRDVRLALPEIGTLRRMEAYFAFPASVDFLQRDFRLNPALEPMGVLGDLGWYCVRYFLHMVDFAMPTSVMGRVAQRSGPENGISAFSGELLFILNNKQVRASFHCTLLSAYEQVVRIKGDEGIITVHGAINPTDEEAPGFTIERNTFGSEGGSLTFRKDLQTRRCAEDCTFQTVQLWRDVDLALMRNNRAESSVVVPERSEEWARMAWTTQCVCDGLLESAAKSAERVAVAMTASAATTDSTTTTTDVREATDAERRTSASTVVKEVISVVEV